MEKRNNTLKSDTFTKVILDSIADGVFTVDRDWKITSFNKAASKITGISQEEAIGRYCYEVLKASICEEGCALQETYNKGKPIVNKLIYIINSKGDQVPVSISTALLKDSKGNLLGGVETFRDLSREEELRRQLQSKYTFENMISKNPIMIRIFQILPDIAKSESTVLIEGESGTGKELVAQAIHRLSPRCKGPLVTVNCAAIPDSLLESELFGYKAGAFTDARKSKLGRFALAEGGTIFLDEIGDISPAIQVKLLRVLQEKTYEPLGGTKPVKADVRVIVATNKDLNAMVKAGKFRADLFYRINVIRIKLPALRERKEDIPLLVDHFLNRFKNIEGKNITGFSPKAMALILNHDYPGNIRELENIVEHGVVLCPSGLIKPEHLPDYLYQKNIGESSNYKEIDDIKKVESNLIKKTLKEVNWNRTKAAKKLGIHPTTLWRKMKKFGIVPPE